MSIPGIIGIAPAATGSAILSVHARLVCAASSMASTADVSNATNGMLVRGRVRVT
jgi:hypothetical protein